MDTKKNSSCQWGSNSTYRFVVLLSMLNEATVVFATAELSHSSYLIFALWHLAVVIFVGLPLVYSQLAIVQYTNCNIVSFWDYFPVFRGFGYGTMFIVLMKNIYLNVLTAWYVMYTVYAALDPPPWFSCNYFNTTKCMVKRINISVFQHCIEAENMYLTDCGMSTASFWQYELEIGGNSSKQLPIVCFYRWRPLLASLAIYAVIYVLSLKREKLFLMVSRLIILYVAVSGFTLLVVSLTIPGGVLQVGRLGGEDFTLERAARGMQRAVLALGAGSAPLILLSRNVPFRAPAAMNAIAAVLSSTLVCLLLALIIYTGLEAMVYFHGAVENIVEDGDSYIFNPFASISEILSYFNGQSIWGLLWFSIIFFFLVINLWLDYIFLCDIIQTHLPASQRYHNLTNFGILAVVYYMSWPFYCIDINGALSDVLAVCELTNSLFFSLSFYWIYGYNTHATDITFMIGIKPSLYWKISWLLNPIILVFCVYSKWCTLDVAIYEDSYVFNHLGYTLDVMVFLVLFFIYIFIVLVGIVYQLVVFYREGKFCKAFVPTTKWGPQDIILYKSRGMFVPKLMTREFLYRQVRIRGYKSHRQATKGAGENSQ